jgi:hypothetical protein
MNDRVITSAMVTSVMKVGQSYHARGIAATFGIPSAAMRRILNAAVAEGVLETRTYNGIHLYSRQGDAAPPPMMAPLTISREMRAAQERCKELYEPSSWFGK